MKILSPCVILRMGWISNSQILKMTYQVKCHLWKYIPRAEKRI